MTREEDYNLIFAPLNRKAGSGTEVFELKFQDGEIRYLRIISIKNDGTACMVRIVLNSKLNVGYKTDVILASGIMSPMGGASTNYIFTWNGDQPISKLVKITCTDLTVDDEINLGFIYQEKK